MPPAATTASPTTSRRSSAGRRPAPATSLHGTPSYSCRDQFANGDLAGYRSGRISTRAARRRSSTSKAFASGSAFGAARTPATGNNSRRLTVNELLASIVEAHGGRDRWRRFNRVVATIVTGGALWGMKNLTQDQDPRRMSV